MFKAEFGAYNKLKQCIKRAIRNIDFIRRKEMILRMNKKDLIKQLSKRCGIKQYKAEECMEAFKEILTETLLNGEKVNMIGLGIFDTVHAKEAMRRNPHTGEPVLMPERIKVRFRASEPLKRKLNDKE